MQHCNFMASVLGEDILVLHWSKNKFLIKISVSQKCLLLVKKLKASGASEVFLTAFEQCECRKDGGLFLALILNSVWVSQALVSLIDIGYPFFNNKQADPSWIKL